MRFKQILHPEIIFGRRGPAELIDFYRRNLSGIEISEDLTQTKVFPWAQHFDPVILDHFSIIKRFVQKRGQIYHVNRDFCQALAGVSRDIPLSLIPSTFSGYVSFPSDLLSDGEHFYQGVYIDTILKPNGKTSLAATFVAAAGVAPGKAPTVLRLCITLDQKSLDDALRGVPAEEYVNGKKLEQPRAIEEKAKLFRALVNILVYIHSQEPELQRIGSHLHLSNTKRAEKSAREELVNECTVPVTFINWGWKRPVSYSVETTTVAGHFRWQACGQAYSQRKLVFIQEHERRYQNSESTELVS